MGMVFRWVIAAGIVTAAVGGVLFLWPVHGDGVSGNAIWPHYSGFGWTSYVPLPDHPTLAMLRQAGIRVPQDIVAARRRTAGVVTVAGLGVAGLALIASSRAWTQRRRHRATTARETDS